MYDQDILVPVSFTEEHIGKLLNMSKRRYVWKFSIGGQLHAFRLTMSLLSAKFMVSYDQEFEERGTRSMFDPFFYETTAGRLSFRVVEFNLSYDLYINRQPFKVGANIGIKRQTSNIYLDPKPGVRLSTNSKVNSEDKETPSPIRKAKTEFGGGDQPSFEKRSSERPAVTDSNERYLSNLYANESKGGTGGVEAWLNFTPLHEYEQGTEGYTDTEFSLSMDERVNLFDRLYRPKG